MIHTVCVKLHDLINANPKFEDHFKQSQEQNQEASQFKSKKPVLTSEPPMHCWGSSLRFSWKLNKLFLSAENFKAEIDQQGFAKDSWQNVIYATHYIKKEIIKRRALDSYSYRNRCFRNHASFYKANRTNLPRSICLFS